MDKKSYALGMSIAQNLLNSGVMNLESKDFAEGVKDILSGNETAISMEEAGNVLDEMFKEIEEEKKAKNEAIGAAFRKEGEEFLAENAGKEGVVVLPSGLQYKVLKKGTGKTPGPTSRVRCHYEGCFTDGSVFDSSYRRGEPAVFGLNQVIRGWTEGLQLMSEGAKYELYIPYQLAYGEAGAHGAIPPCAALKFTVELLSVL